MSLECGMSLAVSTQTTPGTAATAERSIAVISACARSVMPSAPCNVPTGSGMSSI
ncbi:hypothetical protein D9M70_611170 [compost metagenome]